MFIVVISPIQKTNLEELSYMSLKAYLPGQIIEVPIRKKNVKALVLKCTPANESKIEIKTADFAMRKIPQDTKESVEKIDFNFMKSVSLSSEYFLKPMGAILTTYFREEFLDLKKIERPKEEVLKKAEKFCIQNNLEDRIDIYKGIVREMFAKKQSVFILTPTKKTGKMLFEKLKKGIEEYTVLPSLDSKIKTKTPLETLEKETHPFLFIGNLDSLYLTTRNVGAIIVENENSRFYKREIFPYADARIFAEHLAKSLGANFFLADLILRVETHVKINSGEFNTYGRLSGKILHPIQTLIVERKKKDDESEKEKEFKVLSPELLEMIIYAKKKNKKVFLFAPRRGLAPVTLCKDCGTIVKCKKCDSSVTLHKKKDDKENIFLCHHCGTKRSAHETCINCGGWRLEAYGIAIEKIMDEIKEDAYITPLRIDLDETKTEAKVEKVIADFRKKGGVLVGTEMALEYLEKEEVNYSAIVSLDSLLSIPDFRISERILHIITKTKLLASELFLLQGRDTSFSVIESGVSGDIMKIIREEISLREKFNLPPFKKIIKISISGTPEKIGSESKKIIETLKDFNPEVFGAYTKTRKGLSLCHVILRLPNEKINEHLKNTLLSLPPFVKVKVDPEGLL